MMNLVKEAAMKVLSYWSKKSELYLWCACGAAMLAVIAYVVEERPTDVLAVMFREAGAQSISRWLVHDLPPLVAHENVGYGRVFESLACLSVVWMGVAPVVRCVSEETGVYFEAEGIVESRASGTVWIFLLIAAQFSSANAVADRIFYFCAVVLGVFMVGVVAWFALWLIHRRAPYYETGRVLDYFGVIGSVAVRIGAIVVVALLFAAVGPLIRAVVWLENAESDSRSEAKRRVRTREQARVEADEASNAQGATISAVVNAAGSVGGGRQRA
ncbi:hypothetical protein [Actinomyces lilanjuaniae]|uniref:hypothetical protein n=1 Tax=Actinomyces lilanjuaniae TaxID=2321394 RepID=UPI0013C3ECB9|nr:hypothetical protein [Actinomyces lilanjuaniae]